LEIDCVLDVKLNSEVATCIYRELSSTFARLCQIIDQATSDMAASMKDLEKEIQQLESAANSAKVLRNKSDYLAKELDMFEETYLRMYN
jgi:mitofusin